MATQRLRRTPLSGLSLGGTLLLLLTLTLGLGPAPEAKAADVDVPCDTAALIAAIVAANTTPEVDTLNLAAGCTYTLDSVVDTTDGNSGLPSISTVIAINGNGATIERSHAAGIPEFRIFHVTGALLLHETTVHNGLADLGGGLKILRGSLTLHSSNITGNAAELGGGIYNEGGALTFHSSNIISNTAERGGGVYNTFCQDPVSLGSASLTDTAINGNIAYESGGGIYNSSASTLQLVNSVISMNNADYGGGICNLAGATLTRSTVMSNTGAYGGGIYNAERSDVTLSESTVNNNTAVDQGGGIFNSNGEFLWGLTPGNLWLLSSTVSGNTATEGGGVYNQAGDGNLLYSGWVQLENSTVGSNSALNGGGVFCAESFYDGHVDGVEMWNTIVATQLSGGDCSGAGFISEGYNLDSDGSCHLDTPSDVSGVNPRLGPLRNNGGSTWTHALLPGSPAIDQGTCAVTTDQRGKPRPVDMLDIVNAENGCDIGAFEYQHGRVVVNNDEWPLSDEGFPPLQYSDAVQFARNVASWFMEGQPGRFLVYSVPFHQNTGLVGSELESTMLAAGHTWTIVSTPTSLSLDDLVPYDGVFLAGTPAHGGYAPPDTQVLIDYVRAGGNVYLAGGTDLRGPRGEAEQWNSFLRICGLEFVEADHQNEIDGTLNFRSSHPIFAGIQRLYQRDGNSIRKVMPLDPSGNAAILVRSQQDEGLYAVCSLGRSIDRVPTAIDLLSFTAQPAVDHVTLAWQTGTEVDNAGFNISRSEAADGPYTKLNDALIPAEGDALSSASYTFTDSDVIERITYYYKLEDVDIRGVTTLHGPVSARVRPRLRRPSYRPTLPGF
jgi:hypothetical protein